MKRQEESLSSFYSSARETVLFHGSRLVLGLLTMVLLTRALSPNDYGQIQIVMMIFTVFLVVCDFGIPAASVFVVSQAENRMPTAVKTFLSFSWVTSLLSFVLLLVILGFFGTRLFPDLDPNFLPLVICSLPLILPLRLLIGLFRGKQNFRIVNLLDAMPGVVFLVALFGAWLFFSLDAWWAAVLFIVSFLLTAIIAWTRILSEGVWRVRGDWSFIREAFRHGWKFYAANGISILNLRMDLFLVSFFLGAEPAGIYGLALNLAEKLLLLSTAVGYVLYPMVANRAMDTNQKKTLTPLTNRWLVWITMFVGLTLLAVGDPLVQIVFGATYLGSLKVLLILFPGILFGASARVLAPDMAGRGLVLINLWLTLGTFLINLPLNLLLIPRFGTAGAALATTISMVVVGVIRTVVFTRVAKVTILDLLWPRLSDRHLLRGVFRNARS